MTTSSPTGAIKFDRTCFPLVEVRFQDGHEDRDWAWMLEQFEALFRGKQRYALLLDSSPLTHTPSALARKQIIAWQKAHTESTARWCVGASVVIASGLIRGALTAMNWFAPQPVPMSYPPTLRAGCDWCVAHLEQSEIAVPFRLRQRQVALLPDSQGASTRHATRNSTRP